MTPRDSRRRSAVQDELQQSRPFHSIGAEAVVGLMRTGACVQHNINAIVLRAGITQPQYNVLRILRGAGAAGLPTLAIRDRMIDASPGVTRLLNRLERAGYVRRRRSAPDRRRVLCQITAAGLALLARLDAPVGAYDDAAVSTLSAQERRELVRLLDAVRKIRA